MIRRVYGAGAWHAFAMAALTVAIVYVGMRWWTIGGEHLLVWAGGAVAGHDFALLPAYAAADVALGRALRRRRWLIQHVRVPAAMSLLLLAVWWPLILGHDPARRAQTGLSTRPFLGRWLAVTGVLVAASIVAAGYRASRRKKRARVHRHAALSDSE